MFRTPALALAGLLLAPAALAQWTNQYPLADGFNHQVYLEGFELPILNAGPMDPAPSPAGDEIALALRGWLWLLDVASGDLRRVTGGAGIDSRPEWSPDGKQLVFLRDSGAQLHVVALDLASGRERVLVDVDAINLDPVYSPDGNYVYYASAESGPLEIWRVALDDLRREQVTPGAAHQRRPLKRRPLLLAPDSLIVYLHKQDTRDTVEVFNTITGTTTVLLEDRITAQADLALSPDGGYLAYIWPHDGGHELRLLDIAAPDTSVLLTRSLGLPLAPAFSADGDWIYFAEAGDDERTRLKRIAVMGGAVETVAIGTRDWGTPSGRLIVTTRVAGQPESVRLNVVDATGHPLVPDRGAVRYGGEQARVFYYSDGEIELVGPAGTVNIAAVQGFATTETVATAQIRADQTTRITLELERLWDPGANGWFAADNHFHLNYGGPYRLAPDDILSDLEGEGVDVAYPLLANLHNRFLQQELIDWTRAGEPLIEFGQEVRSHFLGHVQLLGVDEVFWPWVWGPSYQLYGKDDRLNAAALRHARARGGVGGYVHPVAVRDPFADGVDAPAPIGFVADALLGEVDLIEVGCLWTDEIGTAALWHQVLNLGIPLAASAGSDVMNNYYRTMAIGAARVYVKPEGALDEESYLAALAAGRSFVTTGPLLEFTVAGREPGQAVPSPGGEVEWQLAVHSPLPYETVEIFVNGEVAASLPGSSAAGSKQYAGTLGVPAGGWVTARVLGDNTGWPAMDSYLYAESSPVWLGEIGSTDPAAVARAVDKLGRLLDRSETRLREGYGNAPIPKLRAHFAQARTRLRTLAGD